MQLTLSFFLRQIINLYNFNSFKTLKIAFQDLDNYNNLIITPGLFIQIILFIFYTLKSHVSQFQATFL